MKYQQHVEKHAEILDRSDGAKVVRDLAKVLDNPLLQFKAGEKYSKYAVDNREEVFNLFCAACLGAHIPIPELEPALYEALLSEEDANTEHQKKIQKIEGHLTEQLTGKQGEESVMVNTIMTILKQFADCLEYNEMSSQHLIAAINQRLVAMNLDPIRPDYSQIKIRLPIYDAGPREVTKTLIVDDDKKDLMKTAAALAGFPNIKVEIFHFNTEDDRLDQYDEILCKTAEDIIALKPQIILMDQGLGGIDGHDLIRKIKEMADAQIEFVANTGSMADEQYKVGALTNCQKGQNLQGIREAIARLN